MFSFTPIKKIMVLGALGIPLSAWLGYLYFDKKELDKALSSEENPHVSSVAHVWDKGTKQGLPSIGGPFQLIDHRGIQRTEADFKGKYLLIYFGYSFCPDICPAALLNISEALNTLKEQAHEIAPVFVTLDPERDTPQHLSNYIESFHPRFTALTGTPEQIETAKKAYRVYSHKNKAEGTQAEYLIDHSSIVYVMDRQGRFVTHFNHATPPQEMAHILKEVVK